MVSQQFQAQVYYYPHTALQTPLKPHSNIYKTLNAC